MIYPVIDLLTFSPVLSLINLTFFHMHNILETLLTLKSPESRTRFSLVGARFKVKHKLLICFS